ncbi:MAG: 5-formyltetrahydrofolate cyclo-ligase [Phycisphaeraceae bacterium]|nr:5-formyltetrahydrofolate cyclo-ligase [Phycisphaeraceae bacterium]
MTDIDAEKQALRRTVKAHLTAMDRADHASRSARIGAHIVNSAAFHAARLVMAFDPLGVEEVDPADPPGPKGIPTGAAWEPDIRPVLRACLKLGKNLAIPRVDFGRLAPSRASTPGGDPTLTPVLISDLDKDLVPVERAPKGVKGLRHPRPRLPEADLNRIDLVIVPGLAFDRDGNRLGRGAGFYDRFLARRELIDFGTTTFGITFCLGLVAAVPHTSRDIPVDAVITETGAITTKPQ